MNTIEREIKNIAAKKDDVVKLASFLEKAKVDTANLTDQQKKELQDVLKHLRISCKDITMSIDHIIEEMEGK